MLVKRVLLQMWGIFASVIAGPLLCFKGDMKSYRFHKKNKTLMVMIKLQALSQLCY